MKYFFSLFILTLFICSCNNAYDDYKQASNEAQIKNMVENSDKLLSYEHLTSEEIKAYLNKQNVPKLMKRTSNSGDGTFGGELVIVCYHYGTPAEDCYGVWGTDDCADTNCGDCPGDNCCCKVVN